MQIVGILTKKHNVESGTSQSGKDWVKQSFEIDTEEKFDNELYFTSFGQGKVNDLAEVNEGERVIVDFNIQCRVWNGKNYTNLDCWRIARKGSQEKHGYDIKKGEQDVSQIAKEDNDLPF